MTDPHRVTSLPATDPEAIAAAAVAMDAGGIVGLPTETVYGLAVVPRPEALAALIKAKQRPEEKGIVLIVDGLDQVEGLVAVPDTAGRLGARLWPGPLTLVLPLAEGALVSPSLTGGRATLGVRIPDHPVPRALARQLGPIAVSSANRTGEPEARSADELIARMGAALALVLDDGPVRGGVPSSVVLVSAEGSLSILRLGALPEDVIRSAAGERS